MALIKTPVSINFSGGLETKVDPFQVQPGKFLSLENSVFDKAGRLTKRNGYGPLTSEILGGHAAVPVTPSTIEASYLTTFNGDLTAIGSSLFSYSSDIAQWVKKGNILPIDLKTIPLIRNSTNQSQADAAVSSVGSTCVVYTDQDPSNLSNKLYKYAIIDSNTGQNIVAPTLIASDPTYGTPRVFLLGNYFIILYTTHPSSYHLEYIAISTMNPANVTAPAAITTSYIPKTTLSFDGVVYGNKLYVAYNTTGGGQAVKITYITDTLSPPVVPKTFAGEIATMFTMAVDSFNPAAPIIYASYYDAAGSTGYTVAVDQNLNAVLTPTEFISSGTVLNLASAASNGVLAVYYEIANTYGYDAGISTNYIEYNTITVGGVVGTAATLVRSVGLASKAFLLNKMVYFLTIYQSAYQPTYFLVNGSGEVVAKLAATNGGSYYTYGLPNITLNGNIAQTTYFYKDLIQAVNKSQGVANTAGVYAQLGINLASFNIGISNPISAEIGSNLNLSGGFLGMYDGVTPVEQGFFLYPDYVEATPHTTGGSMADQQYYYQVTYEWADNQGNIFRSAPSLPVGAHVSGGSGSGSVTLYIPTLRLTYKLTVPPKIVIYRWSTGQQNYYQVTSVAAPVLNDPTTDYITFTDTLVDGDILGNSLIYTTGSVLENIAAPATSNMCLFNNRLFLVDAEDRNLLWFSKQVIEATPVEMTDLLTLYIAPTTASQGSTGPITAIAPMDDKLVIFKQNALGYISGIGPDNTGSNSQYSDFTLINSTVGCIDQQSIVFMPQGLMFQSKKGIWLLGRDLSTTYIGAPVESLTTGATVQSAVNVPGQTQVRFTLDSGITLMYDYYYAQWGSFSNVPAVSSTIYQNLHTYIDSRNKVFQETPGVYLDNTSPVLMSFTTSWINLAGLQGFERLYYMLLLGTYISPFKLNTQIAYDYNPSNRQATVVTPDNQAANYGVGTIYGGDPTWGGTPNVGGIEASGNVFEARIFNRIQKCESFQVSINEVYDPSYGIAAGAGLTLSGLSLIVGTKRGFRTQRAGRSFG